MGVENEHNVSNAHSRALKCKHSLGQPLLSTAWVPHR